MKKFFLLLLPISLFAQSQVYTVEVDNSRPKELQIDQLTLHVDLSFEPKIGKVNGEVEIVFVPKFADLDSIWFDGPGIKIQSAQIANSDIVFKTSEKGTAIFPKQKFNTKDTVKVVFVYEAFPKRGMFFVGWEDKTKTAPKQIWTQGQGIDNRYWVPHVDDQNDKLVTSISATVDADYTVISNGALVDKSPLAGKVKWHYAMNKPHSSYLMMLAIGKYGSFTAYGSGVELQNYFYPDWEERNTLTYHENQKIFSFLVDEIGLPFPWQNYKQVPVMNFQHGAMENTSATVFGDFYCVDSLSFNDMNYVGVNAHELTHQWFGDLVTATGSNHHWLHEGFASYYAWLAEKEVFGDERFQLLRKKSLEKVVSAESLDMFPLAHGKAGSSRFYDKGAWVLHMLRKEVGEKAWHEALKNFLKNHEFGMVVTSDLQTEMEKASGKDLKWFFTQWVYQPLIPVLTLQLSQDKSKNTVKMVIEQVLHDKQEPYNISFPLKIITSKRTMDYNLTITGDGSSRSFQIPPGENVLAVIPDPNFDLLAVWKVSGDLELLENGAKDSKYAWYGAVAGMMDHADYEAKVALKMADAHLLHRIEYARILGELAASKTKLLEEEVLFLKYERNLDVIKSFLEQTFYIQPELLSKVEEWLELPSYEIKEKALMRLCINDRENAATYLAATDGIQGTFGHNVRVNWLFLNIALNNGENQEELVAFSSPAYDFFTRMSAFGALEQLGIVNDQIAANAFGSLLQGNRKLRNAGRDFIKTMSEDKASKKIFQEWINRNGQLLLTDELKTVEQLTGFIPKN